MSEYERMIQMLTSNSGNTKFNLETGELTMNNVKISAK